MTVSYFYASCELRAISSTCPLACLYVGRGMAEQKTHPAKGVFS